MKEKIFLFFLKSIARLPLGALYLLSDFIFLIIFYVLRYRYKITVTNLAEAFPEKSEREIRNISIEYYRFLCDVIVETIKLLDISDKELSKRVKVINPEVVNNTLSEDKNAVLLMGHYGNWEWVQEISRHFIPGVYMASIYHPLTHEFWNNLYQLIRGRWGAHIIPQKKALRQLIDRSHQPWVCGFIADQRPRERQQNNHTWFLNHETYFIYGPEELGERLGSEFFYLEMNRPKRGRYEIRFHSLNGVGFESPYPRIRQFWNEFEKTIKKGPSLWLWSHKRWL